MASESGAAKRLHFLPGPHQPVTIVVVNGGPSVRALVFLITPVVRAGMRSWHWLRRVALAASLLGCAAAPAPARGLEAAGIPGRPCNVDVVAQADTAVDSSDPLLTGVRQTGGPRAPEYPSDLRRSSISGRVTVSVVIDTLGRVPRGGVWIQQESHRGFGQAVCTHLNGVRFAPLTVNGRRRSVRMLNWPITFRIKPD